MCKVEELEAENSALRSMLVDLQVMAYVVRYTMLLEMRRRPRYMCAYKEAFLLGLVLFFLLN